VESKGTLISFTTTLGRKMLKMAKLKVNIVEKNCPNCCCPLSTFNLPTHEAKCIARKKLASSELFGTRPWW
jgi:hypothetical protein